MKKLLGTLLLATVLLTGCGSNDAQDSAKVKEQLANEKLKLEVEKAKAETKKAKAEAEKAVKEAKKETKENNNNDKEAKQKNNSTSAWTKEKSRQLADLMAKFGSVMGQEYDEAYPSGHEINYYGYHYPNDVAKNNFGLNGSAINMVTNDRAATDKNTYQIVGIYSDIDHIGFGGAHLYFFTLKDNQPHVLVTSQNQGNAENLLYFKESENQDLVSNFKSIADGNGHNFSGPAKSKKTAHTFSNDTKIAITNEFYVWATNQAKKGDMAITTLYFNHGAAGRGDWYAETPDGKMLVQDNKQNLPGGDAFPIDIIGGMLFFYALDGTIGHDDKINSGATADGYTLNLDKSLPASKYILGDNGTVYELKKAAGDGLSPGSGFTECNDDGSFNTEYPPTPLIVSEDSAAQTKLQELIAKYS
ncbi:DUF4767 domain-containing protein [Vagococcus fessus]|uniref:DUF4767 domain-containing protein n=1 Tax=Vagococcus fessus TaxID=120370 RepID=A0A430AC23_9ENTE|nr:DUF4767 domain-containing protein [Vagococcus fessus]RSU04772.1 hypothetical protein CBF31_01765 [Vagococcus fessus]